MIFITSCTQEEIEFPQSGPSLETVSSQMENTSLILQKLEDAQIVIEGFQENLSNTTDSKGIESFAILRSDYEKSLSALNLIVNESKNSPLTWVSNRSQVANGLDSMSKSVYNILEFVYRTEPFYNAPTTRAGIDLSDLFSSITEILNSLQSDINALRADISALQGDVTLLQQDVQNLLNSIQSITVVPDYCDGTVSYSQSPYSAMRFEILPVEAASRIASLGTSAFSIDGVSTQTRSTTSSELANYPVTSVSFDGTFVNLLVNCLTLSTDGNGGANLRLKVTDGAIIKGSNFFNVAKISTNLFDKEKAEVGKHIKSGTGDIAAAYFRLDKYGVSDYIPVKGQNIITNSRKGSGVGSINVYDKDKSIIRTIWNNQQYTYQQGDYYIRIAFDTYQEGQANYGTSLLPYESYYGAADNTVDKVDVSLSDMINMTYGVAALSWIDDDFSYYGHANEYNAVHDWCLSNEIKCDIAFTPPSSFSEYDKKIIEARRWMNDGFNLVMHPIHTGWYNEPSGSFVRDVATIERWIKQCVETFSLLDIKSKVVVYPGNSGDYPETAEICKNYAECGICWDNDRKTNHLTENGRYNLRRVNIQPSASNTKSQIKNSIKAGLQNGDWVILGGHIWHFSISDVLDETSMTTANLYDIISYANELCPILPTEEVWAQRKVMFDYYGK